MWDDFSITTDCCPAEVALFLKRFQLSYDVDSDVTLVIQRDGKMLGTGSLRGRVLQCFAIEPELRGMGLAGRLVDRLLQSAWERGHSQTFVFTTPENSALFQELGFRLLALTDWAALLESGLPTVHDFISDLEQYAQGKQGVRGGLVMNCNPFTLGHQFLVECAAESCDHVFLQVVEEDRSVFPFQTRLDLVRWGTAHLSNVTVLPTGPYSVSLATFPSYFTPEETVHAQAGASIDATVYAKYVARALCIEKRFVGTEPLSPVTSIYNTVLQRILSQHAIELVEIPRLQVGGKPISASAVRAALRIDDLSTLASLVPESTLAFLLSREASGIVRQLKRSQSRH